MSEIKLLPCPFCGGEARVVENNFRTDTYSVRCKNCYAESDRYHTQEEAIKQWNTRKPMERIVAKIDEEIAKADRINKVLMDSRDFKGADIQASRMSQAIKDKRIVKEEGGIE